MLTEFNVALALTDTSFMPRPWEMKEKFDLITADFAYVRWLDDRKGIEEQTKTWDKAVVDRTSDLKNWVDRFKSLVSNTKVLKIFAFPITTTPYAESPHVVNTVSPTFTGCGRSFHPCCSFSSPSER